jgi:hypothetical protein
MAPYSGGWIGQSPNTEAPWPRHGRIGGVLALLGGMYLSPILLASWAVVTLAALVFGIHARRAHNRNKAFLRQARKTVQKLESKNGKLWYEVMKTRAGGELYKANEATLTNVESR